MQLLTTVFAGMTWLDSNACCKAGRLSITFVKKVRNSKQGRPVYRHVHYLLLNTSSRQRTRKGHTHHNLKVKSLLSSQVCQTWHKCLANGEDFDLTYTHYTYPYIYYFYTHLCEDVYLILRGKLAELKNSCGMKERRTSLIQTHLLNMISAEASTLTTQPPIVVYLK